MNIWTLLGEPKVIFSVITLLVVIAINMGNFLYTRYMANKLKKYNKKEHED